jgi:hypothetical protein
MSHPGNSTDDASLLKILAESSPPEDRQLKTWTVIGFWMEDDPVAVGTVEGDHPVYGGDDVNDSGLVDGARGPWAVAVEAEDDDIAEKKAVQELMRVQFDDDEDDKDEHG